MSSTLEDLANRVKKDHAASNLAGAGEAPKDIPDTETSAAEEEKETTSITNGEGLANQMNQMIAEDEDDTPDEFEIEEPESIVDPDPDDEDDEDEMTMLIPEAPEPEIDPETENQFLNDIFEVTDEMIQEAMPNVPAEDASLIFPSIRTRTENYRKDQIFIKKLSVDAATEKAISYMKDIADEENIRYLKDHPELLVVSVNKEDSKSLEFTEEERDKMAKAKVIKLEVVETEKLLVSKKVRKVDKRNKLAVVQSMDRYMSQYSVPLPIMNDFVTFKGAQLVEINNLHIDRDTTILEMTEKKANLVYRQLIGGANLQKFDENGKVKMSYGDFLNIFPIYDLDIAVYGVMVASSMEEMETELPCDECGKRYTTKYNMKTLMTMNGLTDEFKGRFNDILKNKSNIAHLKKMYKENNQTYEVESPITKNIYVINHPSIARAIGLYQNLDMESEIDTYFSPIIQFLDKILIYDNEEDDYIEVEDDEHAEMFAAVRTLPQTELNLLGRFIAPMVYQPVFTLKSKCEHCGHKMESTLATNDLVFLATQGSPVGIRL